MADQPGWVAGSFRDPSARVAVVDGRVLRGLDDEAAADFDALERTRFYRAAQANGFLARTRRVDAPAGFEGWHTVLEHDRIPVVTNPFEWSFSMLQDAALLQLRLVRAALDEGFVTKDATPYNVQFEGARPVFIDLPSFEPYREGEPWWGYRQFCQLFLYPLLFTAYKDLPHQPWLRGSIDGITPADALRVLQGRRSGHRGVLSHVWLHVKAEQRMAGSATSGRDAVADLAKAGYRKELLVATIDKLDALVGGLRWERSDSEWAAYTERGHYEEEALEAKADFVRRVAGHRPRQVVWDLGANDGMFSRLAAAHARQVVAADADALVVDRLYRALRDEGDRTVLPLVMNVADVTSGIGWRGRERAGLLEGPRPDLVLALAVMHHLVITHNVPVGELLDLFADLDAEVVLEIPGEDDPMVRRLVAGKREGVHEGYTTKAIEVAVAERFDVRERVELPGGTRVLCHLAPRR